MFTTSMDQQATATTKVVVRIPPKGEDNTVVAELVLQDLTRRPQRHSLYKGYFQRATDGQDADRGRRGYRGWCYHGLNCVCSVEGGQW